MVEEIWPKSVINWSPPGRRKGGRVRSILHEELSRKGGDEIYRKDSGWTEECEGLEQEPNATTKNYN